MHSHGNPSWLLTVCKSNIVEGWGHVADDVADVDGGDWM